MYVVTSGAVLGPPLAVGGTSVVPEPARPERSLQGRSLSESVHRADDEQVMYLYEREDSYLNEVQSGFLKGTTHLESSTAGALKALRLVVYG